MRLETLQLKPCSFPALERYSETSLRVWWDLLWNSQEAQVEIFCTWNNWETGEISHSLALVSQRSHSCLGEMIEIRLRSLLQCSCPLDEADCRDLLKACMFQEVYLEDIVTAHWIQRAAFGFIYFLFRCEGRKSTNLHSWFIKTQFNV